MKDIKAYSVHMGKAKCAADLGDGSERGEYVDQDYILNRKSMKFHWPGCEAVAAMKPENRVEYHGTRDDVLSMGYVPCKICMP